MWSLLNSLVIQRRGAKDYKGKPLCPEIYGTHRAEMSVNLLGGRFEPEFVKFTPNKPKDLSKKIEFDGNYDHDADAFGLYISIPSIHNGTFPALRKFPDQQSHDKVKDAILDENKHEDEDKQVVENKQEDEDKQRLAAAFKKNNSFRKNKEYPVRYLIQVMHRPTNANYWHCQVEIDPAVKKDKAEWQKDALRALTNFLVGYASFEHKNPLPLIKKEWYIKETA